MTEFVAESLLLTPAELPVESVDDSDTDSLDREALVGSEELSIGLSVEWASELEPAIELVTASLLRSDSSEESPEEFDDSIESEDHGSLLGEFSESELVEAEDASDEKVEVWLTVPDSEDWTEDWSEECRLEDVLLEASELSRCELVIPEES